MSHHWKFVSSKAHPTFPSKVFDSVKTLSLLWASQLKSDKSNYLVLTHAEQVRSGIFLNVYLFLKHPVEKAKGNGVLSTVVSMVD